MQSLKLSPAEQSVGHVYRGIAGVLLANALGATTDVWAVSLIKMPSRALLTFSLLLTPRKRSIQRSQSLLTDAIADLRATSSSAQRDLIYNGKCF